MKVLVTGAAGFLGGYLAEELLDHGYEVVGVDNYAKYGKVERDCDRHPRYRLVVGDAKDVRLLQELIAGCDQVVAMAAMIGGISLFHTYAYDLLAENERIIASTFDAAIWAFKNRRLKKINIVSSSMVYESAAVFPTPEGEQLRCPPPQSTYGLQKLACEYFARGAWEQYGLPYTIIRPFNCIGIGEKRARLDREVMSGNVKLAMSHVVPDLAQKVLRGQDPLHILGDGSQVRCFTYGGDLARGIRLCLEKDEAVNNDFNLSTPAPTTVLELARLIWQKIKLGKPFRYISDPPYTYDVKKRVPDVGKAKELLGFEAATTLEEALDEIIPWIERQIAAGGI
ncbi:MAG: NAD(P)-dependent oxidoreductase [Peptococcaceae bacterium]|nr:MAG: NAD(P)-dependent oxidoreductase [Peptococcaceae bacterium]